MGATPIAPAGPPISHHEAPQHDNPDLSLLWGFLRAVAFIAVVFGVLFLTGVMKLNNGDHGTTSTKVPTVQSTPRATAPVDTTK